MTSIVILLRMLLLHSSQKLGSWKLSDHCRVVLDVTVVR